MKITAFLPCRRGSQRVKNKNTRPFGSYRFGLLENKLLQLKSVKNLDEIIVSTNDEIVIKIANHLMKDDDRYNLDVRPDEYCSDHSTTDELIEYVGKNFELDRVLWTHVTSPFINGEAYERIIDKYKSVLKMGYDSLMTVKPLHSFIWNEGGPVNYNRSDLKWPMTQNLPKYYEIDSGVFLASHVHYVDFGDRVGNKVYLHENTELGSFDIDWESDFKIAELFSSNLNLC